MMENTNENNLSKIPEAPPMENTYTHSQKIHKSSTHENEPKHTINQGAEKQRNKYPSGHKHNDPRHSQGYHHINHPNNSSHAHRTNSVPYYKSSYQSNMKKNQQAVPLTNQKYLYKKKKNAHESNNDHVIGKLNKIIKGKSNHNQLFFIHPYEKCDEFNNYFNVFLNLNLKFLRQNHKMKDTHDEEMNEFSVLHSNQGNNNQINPMLYMMMNNQQATANSSNKPNPHINSPSATKNYPINQMNMIYNMFPQFNKTKMIMMQNPTVLQYMLQQQQQNQAKGNNQQGQQQNSIPPKSVLGDPNIQNILSLNKPLESFIHPYQPLAIQNQNPLFNMPMNLQSNAHNNMTMNYNNQQDQHYMENNSRAYSYILDQKAIEENLVTGRYLKGTIRMNKSLTHGYITVPNLANDILIRGRNLNQSINLDEIIVELFPIASWKPLVNKRARKISMIAEEKEEIAINEYNTDGETEDNTKIPTQSNVNPFAAEKNYVDDNYQGEYKETFNTKEERLKYINTVYHLRPEGRIVKIIKSPNSEKEQIAHIENINGQSFAIPIDESLPKIFIKSKKNKRNEAGDNLLKNKYLMVKIIGWAINYKIPKGIIVKEIGSCGHIEVESDVLLRSYNIDYCQNFSQNIIDELQAKVSALVINDDFIRESGRADFRNDLVFTVDPTHSKDLDDAISVKLIDKEKGLLEIGVHIADPSYFVSKESLLDKEALNRVTTVYLVQKNIPMLPRELSENCCSLLPNQDRLAVTCSFRIYFNGALDDTYQPKFELSVVNSKAKWNYDLVQQIIEGETIDYDQLSEEDGIKPKTKEIFNEMIEGTLMLHKLTSTVRGQRFGSGSLLIHNTDLNFILEDKTSLPLGLKINKRSESHNLIEELMLIANKLCAEFLYSNIKDYSLIRRHPSLNDNRFAELKRYLISNGINVESKEPHELNNKLNALKHHEQKFICIQHKLKTFMLKAEYVLAGHYSFGELKHSALNFELYTHFTSPIRRYPDIIVHRQVKDILEMKNNKMTKEKCKENYACYEALMERLNEKYYNGKQISDKSKRIFKCIYLKRIPKKEYTALIVDISDRNNNKKLAASASPETVTVSLYIEELHLELDWKKEDDENQIYNVHHKANSNELVIDYKSDENKIGNKTIKIFDSMTVVLRIIDTVPLDVKGTFKLD